MICQLYIRQVLIVWGWFPFNINPHYLDPKPELKHNGETRETRIKEFLTQNEVKVVGLREGNWIRVLGDKITTEGTQLTRIFEKGKEPYELESGKSSCKILIKNLVK